MKEPGVESTEFDSEMLFEQTVHVGVGHIGSDARLKLGAAADILQNASWFQMDTESALLKHFAEHGLNMYLVARQIDISRFPAYGEELRLRAWIYGCEGRRFGLRNTVMYGEDGGVCMATSATGAFINLENGHGVKISPDVEKLLKYDPSYPMELGPRKIAVPDGESLVFEPVTVSPHHLDSFKHMNNARYVDIASDCLPEGFTPRRVRMEYKRPATLGQRITPRLYADSPERLVVTLDGPDGVCCALEFTA